MSFVRPEARLAMMRWREALVAGGILALGVYWAFATAGLLQWLGYAVSLLGAALLVAATQRARFRADQGGPGVVQVDEGQVAYFGPLTGGIVALGEMTELILDPAAKPAHWILRQPGQPDLQVPLTATGADALFDAFASLPGIRTEHMLAQMNRMPDHPTAIWQRGNPTSRPRMH